MLCKCLRPNNAATSSLIALQRGTQPETVTPPNASCGASEPGIRVCARRCCTIRVSPIQVAETVPPPCTPGRHATVSSQPDQSFPRLQSHQSQPSGAYRESPPPAPTDDIPPPRRRRIFQCLSRSPDGLSARFDHDDSDILHGGISRWVSLGLRGAAPR